MLFCFTYFIASVVFIPIVNIIVFSLSLTKYNYLTSIINLVSNLKLVTLTFRGASFLVFYVVSIVVSPNQNYMF